MAIFSGIDGSITFATGYSKNTTGWSLNIAVEDVETSALGDAWSVHQAGIKDWTGSYTCLTDSTLTGATIGGTNIDDIPVGAAAATIILTAGSGVGFTGTCIVTGVDAEASVRNGPNSMTFNFVGSGALAMS